MPNVWDADVSIDESLVRRLISSQCPNLPLNSLELIGEGWDNAAYLIDGDWIFRFPRRRVAAPLILTETHALRVFRGELPLPIPDPTFEGTPVDGVYPYPFAGYRMIAGESACKLDWKDVQRSANASTLGRFLGALHGIGSGRDEEWAPRDTIRRSDLSYRFEQTVKLAAKLSDRLRDFDVDAVLARMADLAQTPLCDDVCWVHGDLYPCHLLANESLEICGVIDWGDVHVGDPAIDISIAFTFLPPEGWKVFRSAYSGVREDTWRRARFRALHYAFTFIWYGSEENDPVANELGRFGMRNGMAANIES